MSDVKFTVEAVLDSKQAVRAFGQVEKAGQDAAKKVGNSFDGQKGIFSDLGNDLGGISGGFGKIGQALSQFKLQLGAAVAVIGAFKVGLDLALEGEKAALELEIFNTAAKTAGVNAQDLLRELEAANAGIGDVGEISKIAAIGLNELGAEAARYPELLNAARKLSIQFGTDVTDTFQKLNQAILSGRSKSLNEFGVFANFDSAQKELARSLGTTTASLTEQEKRVAALNETLKAVGVTTAAIDLQNETLSVKISRLSTGFSELKKALAEFVSVNFGGFFKDVIDASNIVITSLGNILRPSGENKAQEEIEKITAEILRLQASLADENANKGSGVLGFIFGGIDEGEIKKRIESLGNNLKALQAQQLQDQANRTPATQFGLSEDEIRIQEANLLKANERLAQIRLEARQQELQAKLSTATAEEALQLQIESARLVHEQKLTQIAKDNEQLRFVDKQLLNEIQLAEEERFNAQVTKLKADAGKVQTEEQKRQAQLQVQIAQAANQATTNVLSQGIQALGASLVVGSSAFDNFGQTVLNILGDLMINIGQSILAAQIALQQLFISLTNPANAFAGIATAIALIGVGAALKAVASSGNANSSAATSAPAPTFSGGVTDTGGLPVVEPRDDLRQRQAEQQVSVVINGDVLDSDQSGIRIVELINSAFDKQGVTVRRGVMA